MAAVRKTRGPSDVEVAEIEYTAFTSRKKSEHHTARLIVRRVKRLNAQTAPGQGELFDSWRYHPIFTDSPFGMLEAELHHRQHAIIEQAIADGKSSALAHLPSGDFQANAAWLTLWAMSHNLLRAAGALASVFHAKATTATLRAHLIHVPARLARTARIKLTAYLPVNWPWRDAYLGLFEAVHHPPAPG